MRVSDHAVIRYLERALGMNIGAIREEICAVIASGEIGSEMIVVEDDCAVTVLGPDMRAMDARRAKRRRNTAARKKYRRTEEQHGAVTRAKCERTRTNRDMLPLRAAFEGSVSSAVVSVSPE